MNRFGRQRDDDDDDKDRKKSSGAPRDDDKDKGRRLPSFGRGDDKDEKKGKADDKKARPDDKDSGGRRFPSFGRGGGDDDKDKKGDKKDDKSRRSSPFLGGDKPDAGGSKPGDRTSRPGGFGGSRPAYGAKDDDDDERPGARPGGTFGNRPGATPPAGSRPPGGAPPAGSRPAGGVPPAGSRPAGGGSFGSSRPPIGAKDENDDEHPGARPSSTYGNRPGATPPAGSRPPGGSSFGSSRPPIGAKDNEDDERPGARPGGVFGNRPGGTAPSAGSRPAGGSSFGGSRPPIGAKDDEDDERPGARPGSTFGNRPGGAPGAGQNRPGGPSPFRSPLGGKDDDEDDDEKDNPPPRSASRPSAFGGSMRPSPIGAKDENDDERPGARPGGSTFGSTAARPGAPGAGQNRPGGSSPFRSPLGAKDDDEDEDSPPPRAGSRPGGAFGSSAPGQRPGGAPPGQRPGGFGSSPSGSSGAPGARPGSPPPGGFNRPAGTGPGSRAPEPAKPEEKRSSRIPFLGGKDKDKDKKDDKPARPAGIPPDRKSSPGGTGSTFGAAGGAAGAGTFGSGARPAPKPGAFPARPQDKPQDRGKDKSKAKPEAPKQRAGTQARALPDKSTKVAPRIVGGGFDLDRKLDLIGVTLAGFALLVFVAVLPSYTFGVMPPATGGLTGTINESLSTLFGWGKIVWPVASMAIGVWLMLRYFGGRMFDIPFFRVIGAISLYLCALTWMQMLQLVTDNATTIEAFRPISSHLAIDQGQGGGWFGHQFYLFLLGQLGDWGTLVVLISWLVVSLMLAFDLSLIELGHYAGAVFVFVGIGGIRAKRKAAIEAANAETIEPGRIGEEPGSIIPAMVAGAAVAAATAPPRQMPLGGANPAPASAPAANRQPAPQPAAAIPLPGASAESEIAAGRIGPTINRRRVLGTNGETVDSTPPAEDAKPAEPPVTAGPMAAAAAGLSATSGASIAANTGAKPAEGDNTSSRLRLPHLRGRGSSPAELEANKPDEKKDVAEPEAPERTGGRFGGMFKRSSKADELEAEAGVLAAAPAGVEAEKPAAAETPKPDESKPAEPRRPFGFGRKPEADSAAPEAAVKLPDEAKPAEQPPAALRPGLDREAPRRFGGMGDQPATGAPRSLRLDDEEKPAASENPVQAARPSPFVRPLPGSAPLPGARRPIGLDDKEPAEEKPPDSENPAMPPQRTTPFARPLPGSPLPGARRPIGIDQDEKPAEDKPAEPVRAAVEPQAEAVPKKSPFALDEEDDLDLNLTDDLKLDEDEADELKNKPAEEPRARPAFPPGTLRPPVNPAAPTRQPFNRPGLPGPTAPGQNMPGLNKPLDAKPEESDPIAPHDNAPRAEGVPPTRLRDNTPPAAPIAPPTAEQPTQAAQSVVPEESAPQQTVKPAEPAKSEQTAPERTVTPGPTPAAQTDPTRQAAPVGQAATPVESASAGSTSVPVGPSASPSAEPATAVPAPRPAAPTPGPIAGLPSRPSVVGRPLPENRSPAAPPERPARPGIIPPGPTAQQTVQRPGQQPPPQRTENRPTPPPVGQQAQRPAAPSISAATTGPRPNTPPTNRPLADAPAQQRSGPGHYELPDFRKILRPGTEQHINDEILLEKARVIEDTLASFGSPGKVVEVNPGPVITQFGIEPDYLLGKGGKRTRVKVGSIARLDADLALALAAKSIRIEAPVPGKGFVGIEVPNPETTLVSLYDVMDSPEFNRIDSKLRVALGLSVDGTPVSADLTMMPHLLIAGTTGSGKSVCVNTIISCLLLTNTPDDLQFIMVDPKRVELTGYNGIPHLVAPVVVDLERIVGVLQWVQREMEERYRRFAAIAARNIVDYNGKIGPNEKKLPYYVVIVDELADLMMLAPDETERLLARLAQMARATGIHLIISTQRPSVDIITGLIKANFPARIAFAVASSVDSRVILDQPGAEKLLGRGDMLFQSPDAAAPLRMQGVFVSDEEITRITRYWKGLLVDDSQSSSGAPREINFPPAQIGGSSQRNASQHQPQPPRKPETSQRAFWDDTGSASVVTGAGDDGDGGDDELYGEAVDLVQRLGKASVSLLQRRLRIGYTRAARLIDLMEEDGIVGPAESGSKPREVLKGADGAAEGFDDEADEEDEDDV